MPAAYDPERDPRLLHPRLLEALPSLCAKLATETHEVRLLCGHRTTAKQAALYEQGRHKTESGRWVKMKGGATVTNVNGQTTLSHHNYLPSLALDLGVFRTADGDYPIDHAIYGQIGGVVEPLGFEWGGRWRTLKDRPHVQIRATELFGGSPAKEATIHWQRLLGVIVDGAWGPVSRAALLAVAGSEERTPETWLRLLDVRGGVA